MKKKELITALTRYAIHREGSLVGQNTLACYLAIYFDELDIPADGKWDFWTIDHNIPQLLVGAFETFRTSDNKEFRELRSQYEAEVGREFLDPTDFTVRSIDQALFVQGLGYMFQSALEADWIASAIDAVFNAGRHLLEQTFYKFLDSVYRHGLHRITEESPVRGLSGVFGETTLRAYTIAGRQMLTFARAGEPVEPSVSFVCTDDDPLGLGGGLQTIFADLPTALAMINDVIAGWPADPAAQAEAFKADENVSMV